MLRSYLASCILGVLFLFSCSDADQISMPLPKKAYLHSVKTLPMSIQFDELRFSYSIETTSTQIHIFAQALNNESIEIAGVKTNEISLLLTHGTNLIALRAFRDGLQETLYTLLIHCQDPRQDVRLQSLSVLDSILKPAWSETNTIFSCGKHATNTITVSVHTISELAHILIDDLDATNGIPRPIPIIEDPVGTNQTIRVQVISSDLSTTNEKILFVQYLPPEKEARIREILPSESALVPAFDRDVLSYQLFVSTNRITLTAVPLLDGQTMTIGGIPASAGIPVVFENLTEGTIKEIEIRVTSSDASVTQSYLVRVHYDWVWAYTQVPYDFDGGIKQYLEKIPYSSQNGNTYSTVTILTGIVTAANISHSTAYPKCFFIQDKNAGIYIYTSSTPAEIRTGNKVVIRATAAKYYYGMPEITSYAWQSTISRYHAIYYQIGYYAQPEFIGQVFAYSGPIWSSMDQYYVGKFDEDLYFHSVKNTAWEWMLENGQGGDFFGPISYSYNLFRMEIPAMEHIR